jgi:hypothetical protein
MNNENNNNHAHYNTIMALYWANNPPVLPAQVNALANTLNNISIQENDLSSEDIQFLEGGGFDLRFMPILPQTNNNITVQNTYDEDVEYDTDNQSDNDNDNDTETEIDILDDFINDGDFINDIDIEEGDLDIDFGALYHNG